MSGLARRHCPSVLGVYVVRAAACRVVCLAVHLIACVRLSRAGQRVRTPVDPGGIGWRVTHAGTDGTELLLTSRNTTRDYSPDSLAYTRIPPRRDPSHLSNTLLAADDLIDLADARLRLRLLGLQEWRLPQTHEDGDGHRKQCEHAADRAPQPSQVSCG